MSPNFVLYLTKKSVFEGIIGKLWNSFTYQDVFEGDLNAKRNELTSIKVAAIGEISYIDN